MVTTPELLCSDIPKLSADFLRALLKRRGRSPFTVRIYKWAIQTFVKAVGTEAIPIDRALLERWQEGLADYLKPRSGALARTGMHQLLIWAADRDLWIPASNGRSRGSRSRSAGRDRCIRTT